MSRVLIVGGTGLIGSHIARELSRRGHTIGVLARRPPVDPWLAANTEFVRGDYIKHDFDAAQFASFDRLVYASGVDWRQRTEIDPVRFFQNVNVEAPARLFKTAQANGMPRAVLVSSYYHVVRPELRAQPYVRSRYDAEDAVFAASGSMSVCAVQPSWVMGGITGMDLSAGETATKLVQSWLPVISFHGGTNWVSASSVGFAVAEALERGRDRARYLVGDENWTWAHVLEAFSRENDHPRSPVTIPLWFTNSLAWALHMRASTSKLRTGWEYRSWMDTMTSEVFFSEDSRAELGYPVNDIPRAIAETFRFCRSLTEGRQHGRDQAKATS